MSLFSTILPNSEISTWTPFISATQQQNKMANDSNEGNFRKRISSRTDKLNRKGVNSDEGKLELVTPFSKTENVNFFEDDQVLENGSIFVHRVNMNVLKEALPWYKCNAFNIKREDDCPQGGDDTRLAILRALGTFNQRFVPCVLCSKSLPVYDRYPLIDGTFFLSPVKRCDTAVNMRYESNSVYLQALCVYCMHRKWSCSLCGKDDWFVGPLLIIGTLYTFDVLSVSFCCFPLCRSCLNPIPLSEEQSENSQKGNYNILSTKTYCPICRGNDYHLIRPIERFVNGKEAERFRTF